MLQYDFIILGAGAAGLSLAMRMIASKQLTQKRILIIDKDTKTRNDRTWCFWENQTGFFEELIHAKWDQLAFYGDEFTAELDILPYQYKMIRGIDFYQFCLEKINQSGNIELKLGEVKSVTTGPTGITIHLNDEQLNCKPAIVFNSLYKPSDPSHGTLQLLQHFKGWLIETKTAQFNNAQATLMDFRVHQRHGTSFVYVLPTSDTKALVEYTLFSPKTLNAEQYDIELRDYIERFLKLNEFSIVEEEFGIIPMTNAKFNFYQNGMYNIGIAGGQTKASTGYTFQFIQKQSRAIVDGLIQKTNLSDTSFSSKRFDFYDSVLLKLLISKRLGGKEIFTRLFQKNKVGQIFKFLDNESSLREELSLISTLQTFPFLKAAISILNQ